MENKTHGESEADDTKSSSKAPDSNTRTESPAEGDRDTIDQALREHDDETHNQKGNTDNKNLL